MRIEKTRPTTSVSSRKPVRNTDGFTVVADDAPKSGGASPVGGVTGVGSVDALMALQTVDPPEERRKRAARRGRRIVDALDRLHLGLVGGHVEKAHLSLLTATLEETREETDDPHLESILDQIDLRARVEIEKAKRVFASEKAL